METTTIRVAASPVRCPFCHDGVDVAETWVACGVCLARHHADCWEERSACASCKAAVLLAPKPTRAITIHMPRDAAPESDVHRAHRRVKARRRRWIVGAALVALIVVDVIVITTAEGSAIAPFQYGLY